MPAQDLTLKPFERKLFHPEAPIVRVLGLGPHKTPHFSDALTEDEPLPASKPKLPREYDKTDYGVWTAFTFIIGLSLASFFFSAGENILSKVLPGGIRIEFPQKESVVALNTASSTNEKLGSDDIENEISVRLSDEMIYSLKVPSTFPKLSAKAFIVGDLDNGKIILAQKATTTYPFASVTKLMTALVAKQVNNLHDIAVISKATIATYGGEGGLKAGEKIIAGDLIYPMLLESSNDAAEALAAHYGRDEFISLMNQKASAIGMFNTTYADASGLSPKNAGSAEDLFKLAKHIHLVMPEIFDATRVKEYNILNHRWSNHNHFLELSSFAGGKNGFTDEAHRTSVALFTLPLTSSDGKVTQKRTVALIVLRSDNREKDVATLLSYIKRNVFLDTKTASSTE